MQCLHDQQTARREQGRHRAYQLLGRLLTEQRKVAHRQIDAPLELAGSQRLVRQAAKVATAGAPCLLDQLGHHVHTKHGDSPCGQRMSQPAFAAADVENAARRATRHRGEDGLVGDQAPACDVASAHRGCPGRGIESPTADDLRFVATRIAHVWSPADDGRPTATASAMACTIRISASPALPTHRPRYPGSAAPAMHARAARSRTPSQRVSARSIWRRTARCRPATRARSRPAR